MMKTVLLVVCFAAVFLRSIDGAATKPAYVEGEYTLRFGDRISEKHIQRIINTLQNDYELEAKRINVGKIRFLALKGQNDLDMDKVRNIHRTHWLVPRKHI